MADAISSVFDSAYYLSHNSDVAAAGVDPLTHYMSNGWKEGRDPCALFDTSYYLAQNPDVAAAGVNPFEHYLTNGWQEGRDPCDSFDTYYYLQQNPDVAAAGVNPLAHYLSNGWREGRDPDSWFDTSYYLQQNPDVAAAGMNPLVHYVMAGMQEGRRTMAGSRFNIEVDYSRYDTSGFFANHPERQAVVEEACQVWESIINDEFADVPAGTVVSVLNPNTGAADSFALTTSIDDLRIYLGSYAATDTSLGLARMPAVSQTGNAALDARYNSYDNIEPWVGSVSFNTNYASYFYFDPTPGNSTDDAVPEEKYDFLHIVLHEMGHILGMGPQNAGSQYLESINGKYYFAGPHVEATYGSAAPLDFASGSHFATDATQAAIMKPSLSTGTRVLPTALDKAFFADIGYQIS